MINVDNQDENIKKVPNGNLCTAYASNDSAKPIKELVRRNVMSVEDWKLIQEGVVTIGMSELAMLCVRGWVGLGAQKRTLSPEVGLSGSICTKPVKHAALHLSIAP